MKTEFTMTKQRFYIAALVCACVVIVAAFYAWFSGSQTEDKNLTIADTNKGQEVNPIEDTAAKPNAQGSMESNAAVSGSGIVVSAPPYALPVEGRIVRNFSTDVLVYFQTLDQYMVHQGVDLAVPIGTEVLAAAQGLVSKVIIDDEMGTTVWVAHPGEVTIVYANLDPQIAVEEGDEITKGQRIGVVGETSIIEKNEESHLHLEVLLNGVKVNPHDYFQFAN